MTKFLNTTAINYYLEELIKDAHERLYIISPFLKFNDRMKELIADKNRMKIDVRIIYGKTELAPAEINWLKSLEFVRTSFCENLHAKCYLSEEAAIITSMNLHNFSQVNNNEMGVYIKRAEEHELYQDTYDEAQRLIRVSDEVRLSAEKIEEPDEKPDYGTSGGYGKLTTSKLAKQLGMKTADLNDRLMSKGWLQRAGDEYKLTDAGKKAGGEARYSKQYGQFFLWPKDLSL